MDSYNTPQNASIFNFKRIQNDFIWALERQKFHNEIKNPYFSETRQGSVFAWNSFLGVDVNTPSFIDVTKKEISYVFTGTGRLAQTLELSNDKNYTLIVNATSNNPNAQVTLSVNSPNQVFIVNGSLVSDRSISLVSGTNTIRLQTAMTGSMDSIEFRIQNNLATENVEVLIKNIIMTEGNIALLGANYSEVENKIRWNNTNDYWEITVDEGVTYERIWTAGVDFDNRLNALIDQRTVGLIHQDNILAGAGVTLTPSNIDDQMGGTWPALTISADGGSGGGSGDWTREDVYYQSVLESSDFSHSAFNTLGELQNVSVVGSATYTEGIDVLGTGSISGAQNDGLETTNMLFTNTESYSSFYIDAVIKDDKNVTAEYAIGTGSGFGAWLPANFKNITYSNSPFTELKIKIIFADTGLTTLYSFGVLYGYENLAGTPPQGFLETTEVNNNAGTNISIPHGKWYHKDGRSLEVFYDGIRMLEGLDYHEINIGYPDKSNVISFTFNVVSSKVIVFKEIYGNGGFISGGATEPIWVDGFNNYNCGAFEKLMINTTSSTITINLPSPNIGDEIQFIDKHGTFSNHHLILHSAPTDIMNQQADWHIEDNFAHVRVVYVDNSVGWRVYHSYSFTN